MTLPVTSLLAGVFALFMVPLSLQVSMRRAKLGVSAGDANDETLRRRIRAHGNFIEYAPIALIVVGLIEFGGTAKPLVVGLAVAFFLSRTLHAIGMLYTSTPTLRAGGMLIQHVAFLMAGVWLVLKVS
ncbi:MAG: MAPEG family protein [Acidiferrobacterales bacterium]|nr:MAPEG family protein [Acidiferrobacterales bacterium]